MNFSLIPMPASEELAMGYVPLASGNRSIDEPISFRVIAPLYLLALLVLFQFPSGDPSPDAQSDAAGAPTLAEASCEDCPQTSLLLRQKKD